VTRILTLLAVIVIATASPAAAADRPTVPPPAAAERPADPPPATTEDPPPAGAAQPASAATAQAAAAPDEDPDRDVNLAQPDFALASLPTTLRLPKFGMAFRMTHRFNEPMADAGLGGLYGMDSGAQIGLEFRFGLYRGWQAIVYRTSDKTIQFASQYDVVSQRGRMPFGLAAVASVEGTNNFQDSYSPALGAVVSREVGTRMALYAVPVWVNNSNPEPSAMVDDNSTMLFGLGTRIRLLDTTYVVAEVTPRVSGHGPGTTMASFGIEKRAGGHLFQLTFANGVGTTWAQIARGGPEGNNWYLGFNLVRKFY
jgi:opacity protein-like surface antigen